MAADGRITSSPASSYRPSRFDPTTLGLRPDFRVTDFSKLKGCACKVPQDKLLGYLTGIANDLKPNQAPGMDSSVVETKHAGLYMLSTTDYFSPLVEDPYWQGRVAACNVVSDLYAMGVTEIDTILMMLAVSLDMSPEERDAVATAMIRGFNDLAKEAETNVTGGQTVMNPWPLIGGVAMSTRMEKEFIRPEGIRPGDVLVLTKPLGTQVAVNLWQWRNVPKYWSRVESVTSVEKAGAAYDKACQSMGRLNLTAARLMHEHKAHGATDITGFGILGHANNLAAHAHEKVSILIHTLPIIDHMVEVETAMDGMFKLLQGKSAETSGGLLVALPSAEVAEAFVADITRLDGQPAWVVGRVETGDGTARIAEGATVVHV